MEGATNGGRQAVVEPAKPDLRASLDPHDDLLAAIAHLHAGHPDKAESRLAGARAAIAAAREKPSPWQQMAVIHVLQAEAEAAVLDGAFPDEPFAAP